MQVAVSNLKDSHKMMQDFTNERIFAGPVTQAGLTKEALMELKKLDTHDVIAATGWVSNHAQSALSCPSENPFWMVIVVEVVWSDLSYPVLSAAMRLLSEYLIGNT
jgi:hypothetical protein